MQPSLTGSLEDVPLAEVVQMICLSQRTGTLRVSSPDSRTDIGFCDGQIVDVLSPTGFASVGLGDGQAAAVATEQLELRITQEMGLLLPLREGSFEFLMEPLPTPDLGPDSPSTLRADTQKVLLAASRFRNHPKTKLTTKKPGFLKIVKNDKKRRNARARPPAVV